MQDAGSAMEKGEAGLVKSDASSSPTSQTCSRETTQTSFQQKARNIFAIPTWTWPCQRKARYTTPVVITRLNDYPKGYPNVAAFLDSDEGLTIYRRFGYLQSRILLNKQEDLRRSEQRLKEMEEEMTEQNKDRLCFQPSYGLDSEKHHKLLQEIEQKFCSYSNVLTAAQQMMAFGKPDETDRESVGRYIHNRNCLIDGEASWIQQRDDLITLRAGREHAWFDGVVEGILKICHCKLIDAIFRSNETRKKAEIDSDDMPGQPPPNEDKHELYYTPSRIAKLTNGILTVVILLLLIVPIYVLYHMVHDIGSAEAYTTCFGILLIFTLAFSSVLSLFTKARRHETLAAVAAYCAVLVVFLSNVDSGSVAKQGPL